MRLLAWVVAWTPIVMVMRFIDHLPEWLPGVVFVTALVAVVFFNRKVMPRIARRLIERWWLWPTLVRYLRDTGHLPGDLHRAAAMLDLGWLNAPFARRTIEDWTSIARSETTR